MTASRAGQRPRLHGPRGVVWKSRSQILSCVLLPRRRIPHRTGTLSGPTNSRLSRRSITTHRLTRTLHNAVTAGPPTRGGGDQPDDQGHPKRAQPSRHHPNETLPAHVGVEKVQTVPRGNARESTVEAGRYVLPAPSLATMCFSNTETWPEAPVQADTDGI